MLDEGEILDITKYGSTAQAPFNTSTEFDRMFTLILDQTYFGVYNGEAGHSGLLTEKRSLILRPLWSRREIL